jgi:hypothetical protein
VSSGSSEAIKAEAAADPASLAGTQLWVIPTVDPDGQRARTRKNAHGVDLNRNFPYRWHDDVPHSNGYNHQRWGAVLACRGRPRVAADYAKLVGMHINGTSADRQARAALTVAEGR